MGDGSVNVIDKAIEYLKDMEEGRSIEVGRELYNGRLAIHYVRLMLEGET